MLWVVTASTRNCTNGSIPFMTLLQLKLWPIFFPLHTNAQTPKDTNTLSPIVVSYSLVSNITSCARFSESALPRQSILGLGCLGREADLRVISINLLFRFFENLSQNSLLY